ADGGGTVRGRVRDRSLWIVFAARRLEAERERGGGDGGDGVFAVSARIPRAAAGRGVAEARRRDHRRQGAGARGRAVRRRRRARAVPPRAVVVAAVGGGGFIAARYRGAPGSDLSLSGFKAFVV